MINYLWLKKSVKSVGNKIIVVKMMRDSSVVREHTMVICNSTVLDVKSEMMQYCPGNLCYELIATDSSSNVVTDDMVIDGMDELTIIVPKHQRLVFGCTGKHGYTKGMTLAGPNLQV